MVIQYILIYNKNVIVATLTDLEHSNLGMPPLQRFYENQKLSQKASEQATKKKKKNLQYPCTNILSILLIRPIFQQVNNNFNMIPIGLAPCIASQLQRAEEKLETDTLTVGRSHSPGQ